MSIEADLAATLAASTEALREVRRMAEELAMLRRSLPAPTGTIDDAARCWGLSVSSVRRAIKRGDVPVRRVGRRVLVDLSHRPLGGDAVATLARIARSEP